MKNPSVHLIYRYRKKIIRRGPPEVGLGLVWGGDIYGETQSLQSQRAPASIKHAHDESSCSRHLLKRKGNSKRDKTTPGNSERGGLAMGTPVFLGGGAHTREPARLCAGTMTGTAPARARLEGGNDPRGAAGSWHRWGIPLAAGGGRLEGRPPPRGGGPR